MLALSPIPEEGAGCRFRIAQYLPYLREAGFDVTISSFYTPEFFRLVYRPGHYVQKAASFISFAGRRVRELLDVGHYDLVWLYREAIPLGPPVLESLIARRGVPIVYDFDDAIFLPNVSDANKAFAFLKNPGRVASIVRRSTHVVVGNDYLASFARRHNPAVTVIPTAVDTDRFVPRSPSGSGPGPQLSSSEPGLQPSRSEPRLPPSRSGPGLQPGQSLVVGWIGSPTTYPYLQSLAGVLRDVGARHPFTLKVSGAGQPVEMPGVNVQVVPWSLSEEVSLFNSCDVGVYPLTDDDWARGKCGFKAIQCMACGVPVVAAAVGVNREIISDGVNSFLASTREEWVEKLGRLLTDPALRARMAAAGRRTIEERYSLRVTAPQIATVLASALGREAALPHVTVEGRI